MAQRNYSNIAVETTLSSGITDTATSLVVASDTGWPAAPFVLIIDPGQAEEELILVGGKSGTTFSSLTRGFGGTSGQAHSAGATIQHVLVAEDATLIWDHVHTGAGGDDTAQVQHADLGGIGTDNHHAQTHAIDGADHTGTLDHTEIANQTTDDHHAQDHSSRHLPSGADPVTTAVPGSSNPGDTAAEGTAESLARSDHVHGREKALGTLVGWQLQKTADQDDTGDHDITWDEEDIDTDGFHSGSLATITVPAGLGGTYDVDVVLSLATQSSSIVNQTFQLIKNSTVIAEVRNDGDGSTIARHVLTISRLVSLADSDTLKVKVLNGDDISIEHETATVGVPASWFSGMLIG